MPGGGVCSLYVINKSGGLIYNKVRPSPPAPRPPPLAPCLTLPLQPHALASPPSAIAPPTTALLPFPTRNPDSTCTYLFRNLFGVTIFIILQSRATPAPPHECTDVYD